MLASLFDANSPLPPRRNTLWQTQGVPATSRTQFGFLSDQAQRKRAELVGGIVVPGLTARRATTQRRFCLPYTLVD